MATFPKNSYKFRYRERIKRVLQPWTDWIQFDDTNSTLHPSGKIALKIGDKDIPKQYVEVMAPDGTVIPSPEPFTLAQEPAFGFPYTLPLTLA